MGDGYLLVLERLKEERERWMLTQRLLCYTMQITQSNFSKAETGQRRFSFPEIKSLCSSDMDIFYVFTGKKARNQWEFPESPKISPEEFKCYLDIVYIQAYTARTLNRDKASFEIIQKQLEYIQCGAGEIRSKNNVFYCIRNRRGYTQKKMADVLGMDVKKLQGLEKGRQLPDSEILWKMYDLFQVSPAFILNDTRGLRNELNYMLDLLEDSDRELMLQILKTGYKLIRHC